MIACNGMGRFGSIDPCRVLWECRCSRCAAEPDDGVFHACANPEHIRRAEEKHALVYSGLVPAWQTVDLRTAIQSERVLR